LKNKVRTVRPRRGWAAIIVALGLALTAAADTASCPICGLDCLKDTRDADYQVSMQNGGKSHTYRCVLCAIEDSARIKGDIVIVAPSTVKGQPVKIERTQGAWKVTPEKALFAYAEGSHTQCQFRYRAVSSKEAFDKYVEANPKLLKGAKAIDLPQLLAKAKDDK